MCKGLLSSLTFLHYYFSKLSKLSAQHHRTRYPNLAIEDLRRCVMCTVQCTSWYSEIVAHVWTNTWYLIWVTNFFWSKSVTNRILFHRKDLFSVTRAQHVMSYNLVYIQRCLAGGGGIKIKIGHDKGWGEQDQLRYLLLYLPCVYSCVQRGLIPTCQGPQPKTIQYNGLIKHEK